MVRSKAVVLLLIYCLLFLSLFVGVLCLFLVLPCSTLIVLFLVLQSSWWERESWLLNINCLPDVL